MSDLKMLILFGLVICLAAISAYKSVKGKGGGPWGPLAISNLVLIWIGML